MIDDEPENDEQEELEPDEVDEKETITMYPVPPSLIRPEEDERGDPVTVTRPIHTISVFRKRGMRDMPYLGWQPVEQLYTLDDLLRVYGPGTYKLCGKGDDRAANIKVNMVTVGDVDQEPTRAEVLPMRRERERERPARGLDVTGLASVVTTVVTPLLTFLSDRAREREMDRKEERERERVRQEEDRRQADLRHQQQMEFYAKLLGSRNEELSTALRTMQASKADGNAGSLGAYKEGFADAFASMVEAKESGLAGDDSPENKIIDLVGAVVSGGQKGAGDAEALAREIAARKNGAS